LRRWGATNEVEAMMTLRWRSATVEAEEAMATAMGSAPAEVEAIEAMGCDG